MPIDYQKTVTAGKEFPLEVTLVSGYLTSEEEIKWEMKVVGSRDSSREIGKGRYITYTLGEEYVHEIVVFTAYKEGVQFAWQSVSPLQEIRCYVQPKPQQILIRGVEPKHCNALVWDKVEFRVTAYSIDTKKVTHSTRQSIKWQIRVDGKQELLCENDHPVMSDRVTVEMRQEWAEKEVILIPYLNDPNESNAAKVSVAPLGVNNSKRIAFYLHGTISSPQRWNKWSEVIETLNQVALPDAVDTDFDWEDEATFTNVLRDRWPVAQRLSTYVKERARGFGEVVLIGHSHGGNVAIMAADILAKEVSFTTIYVLTVGTPVFNKSIFTTETPIAGLREEKKMKITLKRLPGDGVYAPPPIEIPTYTYYNPENPENWQCKDKIKHLSIYNIYDRVDGIAQIGNGIIEESRMTSNTCTFEYDENVNVELISRIDKNEKDRFEYRNHCSHRISMLRRLREIISQAELPRKMVYAPPPPNRDQDNTRVKTHAITYEFSGYRKISPLPEFENLTYLSYLDTFPEINLKDLDKKQIKDMHILFEGPGFHSFVAKFNEESQSDVLQEYPYEVDIKTPDLRSPNLKKIDSEIDRLTKEIEISEAFYERTYEDRMYPNAPFWTRITVFVIGRNPTTAELLSAGVKYILDGADNHSFDANSPELIQQAINEGRIKPFVKENIDTETED